MTAVACAAHPRCRFRSSSGWTSGQNFDDTPAVLAQKVGHRPQQWKESHTWGVGRWYLPELLLWINFDNLDNCLESVSLLAPGYRDDLRTDTDED